MIKWYDTIDSTNTQALKESEQAQELTVWIADFQTAGRGQRGNSWESARAKNLTFTILFKPHFLDPAYQFKISQIVTLGIINYLESKGVKAKIKWPNDIYVEDKKICGILIEHTLSGDKLSASVAGIGLNLNQEIFESGALNPISLKLLLENKEDFSRKEELNLLLSSIFSYYHILADGEYEMLNDKYLNNLYRNNGQYYRYKEIADDANLNIPIEKIKEGTEIQAKIKDVTPYGCLILEHPCGKTKEYAFKEIQYIL